MNDDNFFSLDRLVEFGLGINVAGQMVKMMNETLQQMYVPGAENPIRQPSSVYYAIIDERTTGPFSECELSRMAAENKISASTCIWKPGMASWKTASDIPEVLRLVALAPPSFNK